MAHLFPADASSATYPVDIRAPLRLNLSNESGDITVTTADRPDVLVRSSLPTFAGEAGPTGLRVAATHNTFHVSVDDAFPGSPHTDEQSLPGSGWRSKLHDLFQAALSMHGEPIDFALEVPAALSEVWLTLESAGGDVAIAGVGGSVDILEVGGDLVVQDTIGLLRIATASGDATVVRHRGRLGIDSVSGDIRISDSLLDEFGCHNADGDVRLDRISLGSTTHTLNNVSGDLVANVGPPLGDTADATIGVLVGSVSGDVRLGPGFARLAGHATGQSGEGQTVLRVQSISGDLVAHLADFLTADRATRVAPTVAGHGPDAIGKQVDAKSLSVAQALPSAGRRDPAANAMPGAATCDPVPTPADRLTVMRRLQEGAIGIDEAMRVLDGIDLAER